MNVLRLTICWLNRKILPVDCEIVGLFVLVCVFGLVRFLECVSLSKTYATITHWHDKMVIALLFPFSCCCLLLQNVKHVYENYTEQKKNIYIWESTHSTMYIVQSHTAYCMQCNRIVFRMKLTNTQTLCRILINSRTLSISITLPNDVFDFIGFCWKECFISSYGFFCFVCL